MHSLNQTFLTPSYYMHFSMFLSTLSNTPNSHPHLSHYSFSHFVHSPCATYVSQNTSSQLLLLFSTPVPVMTKFQNNISCLVSLIFHITPVLLRWISCSLSTTLPSSPIPLFPQAINEPLSPRYQHPYLSSLPNK